MRKWIIKTVSQRMISWLPQSHKWNALFQRYVTKGLNVGPASFESKLTDCRKHLEHYRTFSPHPKDSFKAVELGTGWWPIIPLGLYFCGADEIWSYDIVPLLVKDTFNQIIQLYIGYEKDGRLRQMLPYVRPELVARLPELLARSRIESPQAILNSLNIHPLVRDARHTGLAAGSVDLVYSNFCFEHIPLPLQADLHREFKRVSEPESVMSHYVGIGDQFAWFDRSITLFNYMKYTAAQWRFLNNPIIPQTRLRASDYRKALERAGCEVVMQENINGSKEDLAKITLAPEFRHYSEEDLLANFSWLVARPHTPV